MVARATKATAGTPRASAGRTGATRRPKPARRRPDPASAARAWRGRLDRYRPGLVEEVLEGLVSAYGRPAWQRWHEPTSELVLTILSQNSADVNAERAFESLRRAYPRPPDPSRATPVAAPGARPGWGGRGLEGAADPDWDAVETAPLDELVDAIRPGGLAPQKAPRIQASLRAIREASPDGTHSLEFLGAMPALAAREWMTKIPGIGPKTASVVLLFAFGLPLMPVDRHVERVAKRIGLVPPTATADQAHDLFLGLLEPDRMYEAHVNLITHGRRTCHARKPECARCPVAARCRFVDPKAR